MRCHRCRDTGKIDLTPEAPAWESVSGRCPECRTQRTAMRTTTGQPIVYADPGQTEILWEDLETALCRQHRYAGFLPWTIADHLALCVLLAQDRGYSPREVALVAAHDLHEAYVLDITKGLKECLGEAYASIEDAWEEHVHRHFGLLPVTEAEHARVKAIDVRALAVEMQHLGWGGWEPGERVLAIDGPMTEREKMACMDVARGQPMAIVRHAITGQWNDPVWDR